MSELEYRLLYDPIFGVVRKDGERASLSLPGVLALLSTESDVSFSALQPHQHHGWFAFLVQLGALARARGGLQELSSEPSDWTQALLQLGEGVEEAWCLRVEDLSLPAFMQAPVPEGELAALKNEESTPDAIDMLVTGRNHDVKRSRMVHGTPEHWALALVNGSTMDGFLGQGNYGVVRMNGGFANRPSVSTCSGRGLGERFVRDVAVWLAQRDTLLGDYGYRADGTALLWTLPWAGLDSVSTQDLDPFFIEICRRVRLIGSPLRARRGGSKKPRVAGPDKGDTGDVWTPIRVKDGASLTVAAGGFHYGLVRNLMLDASFRTAPAASPQSEDRHWFGWALARGQGETQGLHERHLPLPPGVSSWLSTPERRTLLAERSEQWIDAASIARAKILRPAVLMLVQGAPAELNLKDDHRSDSFTRALDRRFDQRFFPLLWETGELDDDDAYIAWSRELIGACRAEFARATDSIPMPAARRYRVVALAEATLNRGLYKHFRDAIDADQSGNEKEVSVG